MSEKYVSGEEHQVMSANNHKTASQTAISQRSIIMIAAVVVLCILSFWGGVNYQEHHTGAGSGSVAPRSNFFGRSGQRRGGLGQVTAISDNSITVQNQRTGNSKTYSITGSTTITGNGQTVPASDIKTGDTVIVMAASSGSTVAGRILVNPSPDSGQVSPSNTQSD